MRLVAVIACVLIGCNSPPPAQPQVAVDPDKAAVEMWLKLNLDDGKWEEVAWYPAVTMTELHAKLISDFEVGLRESKLSVVINEEKLSKIDQSEFEDFDRNGLRAKFRNASYALTRAHASVKDKTAKLAKFQAEGPRRICAMRFRTKNMLGANELHDEMFDVTDGTATRVDLMDPYQVERGMEHARKYLAIPQVNP